MNFFYKYYIKEKHMEKGVLGMGAGWKGVGPVLSTCGRKALNMNETRGQNTRVVTPHNIFLCKVLVIRNGYLGLFSNNLPFLFIDCSFLNFYLNIYYNM